MPTHLRAKFFGSSGNYAGVLLKHTELHAIVEMLDSDAAYSAEQAAAGSTDASEIVLHETQGMSHATEPVHVDESSQNDTHAAEAHTTSEEPLELPLVAPEEAISVQQARQQTIRAIESELAETEAAAALAAAARRYANQYLFLVVAAVYLPMYVCTDVCSLRTCVCCMQCGVSTHAVTRWDTVL